MKVVIIGAGPSGLFCALNLIEKGHEVHLYDKNSGAGKKLLIAGKSGLNLTHSETLSKFKGRYFDNEKLFSNLLDLYPSDQLISLMDDLGIETFSGSTGRIFPKKFKAAQLLKVILDTLRLSPSFFLYTRSELKEIHKDYLVINSEKVSADYFIYCLGGASWKKLGTDGKWKSLFEKFEIAVNDFYSMNCGFNIDWSEKLKNRAEVFPIKNLAIYHGENISRGDLMITQYGLEGTPIYELSYFLQKELLNGNRTQITIDLCPDLKESQIVEKLKTARKGDSLSNQLRKLFGFSKHKVALFHELHQKGLPTEKQLKELTVKIQSARPVDEAISTGGGIAMDELSSSFELKKLKSHFAIGEMLDWVAPTGGFLIHGCFVQAMAVAQEITDQ